jgi:TolB-like protein/Tfp pilus assembly protein PilF
LSVFEELKRRNVFRVGVAYAVASWVLLQVVDVVTPVLDLPVWVSKLVLVIMAIGLVPALLFAWAFEITPEGVKRERDVDRSESVTPQTAKKLDQVTIGLLVLVVVFVIVERSIGPGGSSEPAAPVATMSDKSIAVLAFEDLSQGGDQAYFAEGLSEELLNLLAKIPELQVAGRTSSFAFKGQHRDLREIGEILNVAHVLEGSVRKAGNNIRVTAQLVSTENGFHLFSETYDDELSDIFRVQDDIARQITAALKTELMGAEAVPDVPETDFRAYELYLEARQKIHLRGGVRLNEASALLDAALVIDPNYAPALAQKAMATALLSNAPGSYGDIPQEIAYAEANRYIDKALSLDPELAEAYAVRGLILPWGDQGEKAKQDLERALSINPNLDDANVWLATLLGFLGRDDEATALLEQVMQRDPLFPPAMNNLVGEYVGRRDYDKATALIDRYERAGGKASSAFMARGQIAVSLGNYADAYRSYQTAYEDDPSSTVLRNNFGWVMMSLGAFDEMMTLDMPHLAAIASFRTTGTYDAKVVEEAYPPGLDLRYFNFHASMYVNTGQYEKVPAIVEADYGGLDALIASIPSSGGQGAAFLKHLALAYRALDRTTEFELVMRALRTALDALQKRPVDAVLLWYGEASYAALKGDADGLLAAYEKIVDLNDVDIDPFTDPEFLPYRDDLRFRPVIKTLHDRANAEREKLGWEKLPGLF